MELDKAIQSLKKVKKFCDKSPDWRDIIEAVDSSRYVLMAGGNNTARFVIVSDKEKIQKITDATQQPFISDAKYAVIVCSSGKRTKNLYGEKAENYLRQQAGAAIQNFMLKLSGSGLSSAWIRLFDEEMVKKILDVPENVDIEGIFPVGYDTKELGKQPKKSEIDLDRILFFNKYGNKKMKK